MKRIIKNIVLLLGAALSLSACSDKVVFVYNDEVKITEGDRISYTNFTKLISSTDIYYADGFKYIYKTFEEVEEYNNKLKEASQAVYDDRDSLIGYSYEAIISYFDTLTPEQFKNKSLFLGVAWKEASYNVNSRRIEGVYLKDNYLYLHEYRDYLYKSASASRLWYHVCYSFFIDKKVDFVGVREKTTDLF